MTMTLATQKITEVTSLLQGRPLYLAGSIVAEETYGLHNCHSDLDLFAPTLQVLVAAAEKLQTTGYTFAPRFERVWYRWMKYGVKQWHTNSMRLVAPDGTDTNLVFKKVDGHPTTSLSQVLESFDFGLLAVGYDLESGQRGDLRPFLFPGYPPDGPLPMMPNKRLNFRAGFISQYNGLREAGRFAKYSDYGYDMSLVSDDLVTGYEAAADYLTMHFDKEKQKLGEIYQVIAEHIRLNNVDQLLAASKEIDWNDDLDLIYEALE